MLVFGPYLQDVWVLRDFSASMASKTAFLGIFTAILAEKWPYGPCNARFGHFYTQGMAILVEGRQKEVGILGARQVHTYIPQSEPAPRQCVFIGRDGW